MNSMKKLILIAILFYGVSCSNPEDKATGDPDSTSFNNSGDEKVLNTASDINNPASAMPDSSSAPATMKENANSNTSGTNRAYSDTSKH